MNKDAENLLNHLKAEFEHVVESHDPNRTMPYSRNIVSEHGFVYYKWNPYHNSFRIARVEFDEEVQKQGVFMSFLNYAIEIGGKAFPVIEIEVCQNPYLANRLKKDEWESFGDCEISLMNCPSFRKKTESPD